MKRSRTGLPLVPVVLIAVAVLAGCTTVPNGPSTMALPGTNKGFDQFRYDEGDCRQYASDAIGGQTGGRVQEETAVKSAVAGAVIGALIGGAINGGHGAGVGAAVGAAGGGIAGLGAGEAHAYDAQRRYDQAYQQCMCGKGHRVAVSGRLAPPAPAYAAPPPPPRVSYGPPPPPPGYRAPSVSGPFVPPPGSAPGY